MLELQNTLYLKMGEVKRLSAVQNVRSGYENIYSFFVVYFHFVATSVILGSSISP